MTYNPLYKKNVNSDTVIHISDLEQMLQFMKAIEINTRKPKNSRFAHCISISYHTMAIFGMCVALTLSCTMLYISWIGFYPPGEKHGIFFIDRLNDLKDIINGLRSGSIQDSFTESLVNSFNKVVILQNQNKLPPLPL